jgi:hypothetical protein
MATINVYTREISLNTDSSTLVPDRPQRERLAVYLVAQQYSSATFLSFSFHSLKEHLGAHLKQLLFRFYPFFGIE